MQSKINEIVKEQIRKKNIKQYAIAKEMGLKPTNFSQRLTKSDLDTGFLMQLSKLLEYDFFSELSKQLPDHIQSKKKAVSKSELEEAMKKFIEENYPKIK